MKLLTSVFLLITVLGLVAGGGSPRIDACPDSASLAIVQALGPLGQTTVQKIIVGLGSRDIPAMFQAICESQASEETLTTALTGVKAALVNCRQNDSMVLLLGSAETADIMDICTYSQSCPNITANLEAAGTCLGALRMATQSTLCAVHDSTCACIQIQAGKCAAASKAGIFQRRIKMVYDAGENGGCDDLTSCKAALDNAASAMLPGFVLLLITTLIAVV